MANQMLSTMAELAALDSVDTARRWTGFLTISKTVQVGAEGEDGSRSELDFGAWFVDHINFQTSIQLHYKLQSQ